MTDELEPQPSAEDTENDPLDVVAENPVTRDEMNRVVAEQNRQGDTLDEIKALLLAQAQPVAQGDADNGLNEPEVPSRPTLPQGTYARYRHTRYSDASVIVHSQHHQIIKGNLVSGTHREMEFHHHIFDLTDRVLRKWGMDIEVEADPDVAYADREAEAVSRAKALIERLDDFRDGTIVEDPWSLPHGSVGVQEGPSSVGTRQPRGSEPIRATVVNG